MVQYEIIILSEVRQKCLTSLSMIISLYVCTTSSLSIHLLMDIQIASISWLLQNKQCCNEHWGTYIFSNSSSLQIYAQEWMLGSYGNSVLFFKEQTCYLHSGTNLHCHHQCRRLQLFPTASPAFVTFRILNDGIKMAFKGKELKIKMF